MHPPKISQTSVYKRCAYDRENTVRIFGRFAAVALFADNMDPSRRGAVALVACVWFIAVICSVSAGKPFQ